jgi:hypothetical protein
MHRQILTRLVKLTHYQQTIMAIAGHVSRKMLEHYSHIRMEAKRAALDAIVEASNPSLLGRVVHQNVHQPENAQNDVSVKSLN